MPSILDDDYNPVINGYSQNERLRLRDAVAMRVLQALVNVNAPRYDRVVEEAFEVADEFLKQRNNDLLSAAKSKQEEDE